MEADDEHEPDGPVGTALARRLVEMLVGRELERIARSLERTLGAAPDDADDAVCDAVVRTLDAKCPPDPSKVGVFVLRAAQNRIVDGHRARRSFDGAAPDLYDEHDGGRLAEHVVAEDVFRRI